MLRQPPNNALSGADDGGMVKDRQSKPALVNTAAELTRPEIVPPTPESAGSIEHRTNTRYSFTATAEILEPRSGARIAGRTADISSGGCYVDTISPLPVGTPVKLRLSQGHRSFESQAAVVYAHVGMGMGLAFTEIRPDQLPILQAWIGELSGELTPAAETPEPPDSKPPLREIERHVLNQLISLLIRKRILTEGEGTALLRDLFG